MLDQRTAAKTIKALIGVSRSPGELTAKQATKLADTLAGFAVEFPAAADRCHGFAEYIGQLRATAHVKTGGAGTWKQNADIATILAKRDIDSALFDAKQYDKD